MTIKKSNVMETREQSMLGKPWMITKAGYEAFSTQCRPTALDVGAAHDGVEEPGQYRIVNSTAIIKVKGVLVDTEDGLESRYGEVSIPLLSRQIALAGARGLDIIMPINSPGGTVNGIFELADLIEEVAKKVKVVALATGTMASSAMLLASSASERYISGKTNYVGSIGVYQNKIFYTKHDNDNGIFAYEFISGVYKNLGSPDRKTDEFEVKEMTSQVSYIFSLFVDDVSRRLGIPRETIIDMQARIFIGKQAIDAGLVDGSSTIEQLINANKSEDIEMAENTPAPTQSDNDALMQSVRMEERARMTSIQGAAFPGQEALVRKCIEDGVSAGDAALMFNQDEKAKGVAFLASAAAQAPAPVASVEPASEGAKGGQFNSVKEEFAGTPAIRAEFGDLETYEAFCRADSEGRIRY